MIVLMNPVGSSPPCRAELELWQQCIAATIYRRGRDRVPESMLAAERDLRAALSGTGSQTAADEEPNPDDGAASPLLLTTEEVAQVLRLSQRKVRALADSHRLSAVRVDRCVRFRRSDVEQFAAALTAERAALDEEGLV